MSAVWCLTIYPQRYEGRETVLTNCWFYSTSETVDYKTASDNEGVLYIPLLNGKLISINSKNAEKNWEAELAGEIRSDILADRENVYVTIKGQSESPAVLYSLSKNTGITRWKIRFAPADKVRLYDSENNIILIFADGTVYSVVKLDGRIDWKKSLGAEISAFPLMITEKIIVGTFDKKITALSSINGEIIEKFEFSAPPTIIVEDTTGNNLIIGDKKGILRSFNKRKKTRNWDFRQGAEISNITHTLRGVLVSSFDNFVYLIAEASGKLIWKRRLSGRIAAAPQINDGNFIIASIEESEALVINLGSGKVVNKIVLENNNFFTGESIRLKNLFIYATRQGIFGFSLLAEGCGLPEK